MSTPASISPIYSALPPQLWFTSDLKASAWSQSASELWNENLDNDGIYIHCSNHCRSFVNLQKCEVLICQCHQHGCPHALISILDHHLTIWKCDCRSHTELYFITTPCMSSGHFFYVLACKAHVKWNNINCNRKMSHAKSDIWKLRALNLEAQKINNCKSEKVRFYRRHHVPSKSSPKLVLCQQLRE